MDITILCIGSLIVTIAAWVYLNALEPKLNIIEETDNHVKKLKDDNTICEDTVCFAKPSIPRLVFLVVMFLSLCVISISLELIFYSNTIIDNGKLLCLLAILFIAANVDARCRIIPNALVLAGLVLRIVFWLVELINSPTTFLGVIKNDLTACLIVIGFFIVGVLLMKGGIGMGDIKLMLVMCLFQGFYGVISSLFCSLFIVFIYAVIALLFKKKNKKNSVAFAPAILFGTVISVFLTGM